MYISVPVNNMFTKQNMRAVLTDIRQVAFKYKPILGTATTSQVKMQFPLFLFLTK